MVAVLGPDEFCGEGCLTGQPRRLATATAMTECEIMRLEKAPILRVLREEPAFSEMFISHLLARTIRVEEDLVDPLFKNEKRLARMLLQALVILGAVASEVRIIQSSGATTFEAISRTFNQHAVRAEHALAMGVIPWQMYFLARGNSLTLAKAKSPALLVPGPSPFPRQH